MPPDPVRRCGLLVVAALLLLVAAAGCTSDGGAGGSTATTASGTDRSEVLAGVADRVMVPAHSELAAATAAQTTAIDALCATPGAAELAAAREAWLRVNAAWGATSAFRFGPVADLRLVAAIDFPIEAAEVAALADGSTPIDADLLSEEGADVRGSGAIEWVLFAAEPVTPHRCAYVLAAAELVDRAARRVHTAWTEADGDEPSFRDQLAMTADGGMYASDQDALADVVNGAIFSLEDAAEMTLEKSSGALTGEADPAGVDSGRARQAREDALAALASAEAVYDGGGGPGIGSLVAAVAPETDERMQARLAEATQAVGIVPAPIAAATDLAPLRTAFFVVRQAQVLMGTEVASALGITLAFADTDGDS